MELEEKIDKILVNSLNLFQVSQINEGDIEEKITKNYININKSYLELHTLNNYKYLIEDHKELEDKIKEAERNYNLAIDFSLGNLSMLAVSNIPDFVMKDIDIIKKYINFTGTENYFIFPSEDKIILTCNFLYKDINIIFSNVFSENNFEKYINFLPFSILPGKFDLGNKVEDVELFFNSWIDKSDSISDLILKSTLKNKYFQIQVKEDTNIKKIIEILLRKFNSYILSYKISNGNIFLSLINNLGKEKILEICDLLKVSIMDRHRLLLS